MELDRKQTEELQKVELEIFKEFLKVCEKLDLKYYLLGGTLLGAVRHNGFIPWDDDIDIGMPRADYEKFICEAQKHLPAYMFVQTYKTDPEYHQVFAKIRNSKTTYLESSIKNSNMNHGIFIDVFPLDIHSDKKNIFLKVKKVLADVRIGCVFDGAVSTKLKIVQMLAKVIFPDIEKAKQTKEKIHKYCKNGNKIANYSGMWGEKEIVPAEWYGDWANLTFEGIAVKGPSEYDKWLTQVYGDYMKMPPVEKRITHHKTEVIDTRKSYLEYLKN